MKLYEVPRRTKIRLIGDAYVPPSAVHLKDNDVLLFDHLDGMYAFCYDVSGNIVHPMVTSEVEVINED